MPDVRSEDVPAQVFWLWGLIPDLETFLTAASRTVRRWSWAEVTT